MAKVIVNLTLSLITEEIENVLCRYHNYFYQQAFSSTDLRQELIAYVLNRVPSSYIAIEEGQESLIKYNLLYQPLEKRLHIETIICQGIHDILQATLSLTPTVS